MLPSARCPHGELWERSHRHHGKGPDPVTLAKRATVTSGPIVARGCVPDPGVVADGGGVGLLGALLEEM